MSDMPELSKEAQLVYACFIDAKYPMATRSVKAIVRQTGLPEAAIVSILESSGDFFKEQASEGRWSMNIGKVVLNYFHQYPQIFSKVNGVVLVGIPMVEDEDLVTELGSTEPESSGWTDAFGA